MASLMSGLRQLIDGRRVSRIRGAAGQLLQPLEARIAFSVVPPDNHTIVRFNTTYGNIYVELFDDDAPISVANFLHYITTDKLDKTFFHRMTHKDEEGIDVLQGGGFYFENTDDFPRQVDTFDAIALEDTHHSNIAGTLAMARQTAPNTGTSQFFFNVTANTTLDYKAPTEGHPDPDGYAVFGQIVKGMDVLQTIFALRDFNLDPDSQNQHTFDTTPVTAHYDPNSSDTISTADLVYLNDINTISRADYRAVAGSAIDGSVNTVDQLFITSLGLDGRAQTFLPDTTDQWHYQDLKAATGSPDVTGNLAAFHDYKTGLRYATGPSASGLILYTQAANGTWSFTNLTTTVNGGQIIEGEVTVFTTTDGFVYIAGMSDAGHLVAFRQVGTTTNFSWEYHDFTTQDLQPRGLTTPAYAGRITSYVTAWNGLNIVGLDGDGEIQAVWWAPGIDQNLWTATNLSETVNAPKFTGGLTVYLTSWYATNIVGITQDGHVSATWWVPEAGGGDSIWRTIDLTADFSGAQLVGSTISSFVTPWGATNIAGLDSNGKLWVYWWAPASGAGNWTVTDLASQLPADTKPMVGRITGVTSPANTINLVGSAANGDVMRYHWNPFDGLGWQSDDVSYLASVS